MLQHPRRHQIEPTIPGESHGTRQSIIERARTRLCHDHPRVELEYLQCQYILERLSWGTPIRRIGNNLQQIMHRQPWKKAGPARRLHQLQQCGKRKAEPAVPESNQSSYSRILGQGISIWEDQSLPWSHSRVQQGEAGGWIELRHVAQDVHGARQSSIGCQCQLEDAELQWEVRRSRSSFCDRSIHSESWTSWQSSQIKEIEKADSRTRIGEIEWTVDRH